MCTTCCDNMSYMNNMSFNQLVLSTCYKYCMILDNGSDFEKKELLKEDIVWNKNNSLKNIRQEY